MLSGEDFLGGEVQNSVNLPMVRFFDNILGLIFLETCLDLRLFEKVISKLKRWYIQENFVKDNFFKKTFWTVIFLKEKKIIFGKIFFGKEEEAI